MSKRVVILGAGQVGSELVKALSKKKELDVTVVDRRQYYENNIGSVRSAVEGEKFWSKSVKPHEAWIPDNVTLEVGDVQEVRSNSLTIADGGDQRNIDFDYLVVATGVSYPFFLASSRGLEERKQAVNSLAERIERAKSVMVIGGGPVGVETTGEILSRYPDKKVTLVHSRDRLVVEVPEKASRKLKRGLEEAGKNLKFVFNDRVPLDSIDQKDESLTMRTYKTQGGVDIDADLVIVGIGATPNTQALQRGIPDAVDERGFVRVNRSLVVDGHDNMFAVGDVINTKVLKMAYTAQKEQVPVVVANLVSLARGKGGKLKEYAHEKSIQWPFITSVTPSYAVVVLPMGSGVTFGAWMWSAIKTTVMKRLP